MYIYVKKSYTQPSNHNKVTLPDVSVASCSVELKLMKFLTVNMFSASSMESGFNVIEKLFWVFVNIILIDVARGCPSTTVYCSI